MSTLTAPKRIILSHDEILEAIKKYTAEKHKEALEGEEFEITVTYDSYNYLMQASIECID